MRSSAVAILSMCLACVMLGAGGPGHSAGGSYQPSQSSDSVSYSSHTSAPATSSNVGSREYTPPASNAAGSTGANASSPGAARSQNKYDSAPASSTKSVKGKPCGVGLVGTQPHCRVARPDSSPTRAASSREFSDDCGSLRSLASEDEKMRQETMDRSIAACSLDAASVQCHKANQELAGVEDSLRSDLQRLRRCH